MRKRSEEILQLLVKGQKKISIFTLKKKYQVTERTIKNDLAEINEFLRNLRISDIYFDSDGELNTDPNFDSVLVEIELIKMNTYIYKMSPQERHVYITLLLLWDHKYLIMKDIADKLYVSRLTILNDFESIKEEMENKEAEVLGDAGKGVCIRCSEEKRMELLVVLFRRLTLEVENEGFFQRFVLEQLNIQHTFNEICSWAQEYLSINNLVFIADALYDTVLYLFVVFNLKSGKQKTDIVKAMEFNENDDLILYIGDKLSCPVSDEMRIGFRNYIKNHEISLYVKNLDEIEFYEIIIHFLSRIDQDLNLNLCRDNILIDSLLLHIKNMRDWGDLEFEISDLNEIVFDYQRVLTIVDKYLFVLEKYLSYNINDNMKKSIMIHICVAMIRNNKKSQKPSVVIVCPGSMATGRYLEAQIKNYFDFNIRGLFPVSSIWRQLEKIDDVDFIISTAQLHHLGVKCLKVHAVLTMQDMNLIQKTAFEYQNQKSAESKLMENKRKVAHKLQALQQDKELPDRLYQKIETVILEYENEEKDVEKTAIGELLEKESIIFDDSSLDWEQGIRKSAAILIEKRCIGSKFVEKAIQNIKDYGDYIILGNGVALAHAGKDYEVYKDGLSLLVSYSGIVFSNGEREVNFLFCFSSRGIKDYIDLFHEIVEIGQNEGFRNTLLQMSGEELCQTLCFKES